MRIPSVDLSGSPFRAQTGRSACRLGPSTAEPRCKKQDQAQRGHRCRGANGRSACAWWCVRSRCSAGTARCIPSSARSHLVPSPDKRCSMRSSTGPTAMRRRSPSSCPTTSARRAGASGARSAAHLRHSLDIIWVTCSLLAWSEQREASLGMEALVQVSLAESQTAGILGPHLRPDSIIALQSAPFSGVLCVEVDEATERSASSAPSSPPTPFTCELARDGTCSSSCRRATAWLATASDRLESLAGTGRPLLGRRLP